MAAVLRDPRWEDFGDLVQNFYACFDERDAGEPIGIHLTQERPSMEEEMRWFGHFFTSVQDGSQVATVADLGGHAVGFCGVRRRGTGPTSEEAHVGDLGILLRKSARGQGVGEQLLRETIRRCEGRFAMIVLSVFADNERAKALYRKVGFRPYGTLPGGILRGGRPIDVDHMFLPLASPVLPRAAGVA